jgi:hypothetical protein
MEAKLFGVDKESIDCQYEKGRGQVHACNKFSVAICRSHGVGQKGISYRSRPAIQRQPILVGRRKV